MESEDPFRYYLDEVNDTQHDIHNLELEEHIPNGKSFNYNHVFDYLLTN